MVLELEGLHRKSSARCGDTFVVADSIEIRAVERERSGVAAIA